MWHATLRNMVILYLVVGAIPAAQSQQEFSIYCSSNMDGTGKCRKVDTDQVVNCLIIPGGIVACRDKNKKKYECVEYGAVAANQMQFACMAASSNSVNDKLFEGNEFEAPSGNKPNPNTNQTLPDSVEPTPTSKPSRSNRAPTENLAPMLLNPFQLNPSPPIESNEFQTVF